MDRSVDPTRVIANLSAQIAGMARQIAVLESIVQEYEEAEADSTPPPTTTPEEAPDEVR